MALPFQHPTTIMFAGPTGCGKTQLLLSVIERKMIQPPPKRIICVYGEWQDAYDKLRSIATKNSVKLEFVHNPSSEEMETVYESIKPSIPNLVIVDDQMSSRKITKDSGGDCLTKLFTQGSHHRNLTVIYIVQNVFHQSSNMRSISLNTHYLVLFKSPRDKTQARVLGQQMYPRNNNFLVSAYEDAISEPFGYLLIDLHPRSDDALRIRSRIFDPNGSIIYQPGATSIKASRN